ncbi:MAG: DUF4214 domain-containing protein, partial [Burkholderiaceae bacterium]|nr:DUF4214 domain-containing protein [Burkholderiaceae bacterium]
TNLTPNDGNKSQDVYLKDTQTGKLTLLSASASQHVMASGGYSPEITQDGHYVVFSGSDGVADFYGNPIYQIYMKDLRSGDMKVVSSALDGGVIDAVNAHLSANGRYLVYDGRTSAMISGALDEVYWKDLFTGEVRVVSIPADQIHTGQGDATATAISPDGRLVAYVGWGKDGGQIYLRDMETGVLKLLSASDAGVAGNDYADLPTFSGDGHTVSFYSYATNLIPGYVGPGYQTPGLKNSAIYQVTLDSALVSSGNSVHTGTAADDIQIGGSGNDRFTGMGGNDSIDGGAGIDTAVYLGPRSAYTITAQGQGFVVSGASDGSDTLVDVERLHFADADIALDIHGTAGQAYRLYQAAFNRAPDGAGLGYWIKQMDQGASLESAAASFLASPEAQTLYGSHPSNAALVDAMYANVLHRAGDAGGIAYWRGLLDQHNATPAQVLASFSESAENQAALVGVLQNGFAFTPYSP